MTFWSLTTYSDTPPSIRHNTILWPCYRNWAFSELREVSIKHLQHVWHANRGGFLQHLVPSHLGDLRMLYLLALTFFIKLDVVLDFVFRTFLRFRLRRISVICLWTIAVYARLFTNTLKLCMTNIKMRMLIDEIYFLSATYTIMSVSSVTSWNLQSERNRKRV